MAAVPGRLEVDAGANGPAKGKFSKNLAIAGRIV
jgi:hypothetical protein